MHGILTLSILIIGLLIQLFSNKNSTKKLLSVCGGINLFFYGALRSILVGTDVLNYVTAYLYLPNMSFASIFTSTHLMVSRDPFFYTFMKLLTFISEEPQFMLIVISGIVAICFSVFVYRNSDNPILSFIMFIGLRYYSFTLSGLRQAIAWSIVMLSYEFIKEKKIVKFIMIVFLASLFHGSAILFILAYPLANIKRIERLSVVVIGGLLLNSVTNHLILKLLVKLPGLQQYTSYIDRAESATTGMTMIIIYVAILVFAFLVRKQIIKKNDDMNLVYNLSAVGVAITILSFSYANLFRIGYYFIFPIVILLPCAINSTFNKKSQILINIAVIALLVGQFILIGPGAGTQNYQLFWK